MPKTAAQATPTCLKISDEEQQTNKHVNAVTVTQVATSD